ncbi:ergothioneine biosynthesis glutamate--cysteine ligase EgtA [Blastococcus saxobsidens]|uniref:Glutamate--cysteine ligase EgtA n=1 Tax=Blastococcus saxobsidens TaxID=138336 RepID=A0A4Q7Y7B6_9ACTN|nr:ergothioneine biosynthesis glutamate--cysteine ligase EgtA [Blastococcus saxobsidens]RZU31859.1 glutamate--cysteine ligase [Blastococcus saxobsidens]
MTAVTVAPSSVVGLDEAVEHIAGTAFRAGPIGRVGLELESHLVDLDRPGSRVPWERVTGLVAELEPLPEGSRVTLEPGGQVELSSPPAADAAAAVAGLRSDRVALAGVLSRAGLGMSVLGTDPLRPPLRLSPAGRYAAMEQHFAAVGCQEAGIRMMTSTAALQVNLEAGPAPHWAPRMAQAHRLGPVLVAVSACSPLLGGHPAAWRSGRQHIWAELDRSRCAPALTGNDPAADWATYALAAPVMLVRDPATGAAEAVRTRTPMAEWLTGTTLLAGRSPTVADLDYHLTTLFPPVRPRGYLELRYLDAAPEPWWPALAAVTATLLDDPAAADRAADACAPVEGRWVDAARIGLADRALRTAAVACLAAAVDTVHADLRPEVCLLADLVSRGHSPGDAVLARAGGSDPLAVLAAATDLPGGDR